MKDQLCEYGDCNCMDSRALVTFGDERKYFCSADHAALWLLAPHRLKYRRLLPETIDTLQKMIRRDHPETASTTKPQTGAMTHEGSNPK
jgi:hypothetical protein